MKLLKYPAHSDDFYLICCEDDLVYLLEGKKREWEESLTELYARLVSGMDEELCEKPPFFELMIEQGEEGLIGIACSKEVTSLWMESAIENVLNSVSFVQSVRRVTYGRSAEHRIWSRVVKD